MERIRRPARSPTEGARVPTIGEPPATEEMASDVTLPVAASQATPRQRQWGLAVRFQSPRRSEGSDSTEDLKARSAAASDGSDSTEAEREKAARRKRERTGGIVGKCWKWRGIFVRKYKRRWVAEEGESLNGNAGEYIRTGVFWS